MTPTTDQPLNHDILQLVLAARLSLSGLVVGGKMSQTEVETIREAVNRCCFPALNIVRGIELDVQGHPDCPFRRMAPRAASNLMELMEIANGQKTLPVDR